jgi:hypothetical protein
MIKQVTEIDTELLTRLDDNLAEIRRGLENLKAIQRPEYLTREEFMAKVKIRVWKFNMLKDQGVLQYKKIGKKIYVHESEIGRYFDGKMTLND